MSGKKRNLIVLLGKIVHRDSRLRKTLIRDEELDLSGSEYFRIMAYASENVLHEFESSSLYKLMESTLNPGDHFVDIGANIGGYSFLARKLNCMVTAFEPVPELAKVMSKNEPAFGEVVCMALSDKTGMSEINISKSNIGGSSLENSKLGWKRSGYSHKLTIYHEPFDRFFANKIEEDHIFDLVKIDVEGHEEAVVKGMADALGKNLIKRLWCEVRGDSSDRNPGSFRNVCEILTSYGFEPFAIIDGEKKEFAWKDIHITPQYFDLLFEKP